ncbi:MAG: Y-family DNA polymerase [Flavobacteriaceae bacterium]
MMFALVDCNNFYASCERVFQPQWKNKPIVILSNNDGCVIARSNEAKALGVPMGAPAFQYKALFAREKIKVFSSNYPLYGDMSSRVMKILERYTPNSEIYSIDEAFLQFKGFDHFDLDAEARAMKKQVQQWTGIPVSIGIAPSKGLAKIANKIAKKFAHKTGGVYLMETEKQRIKALQWTKTKDIWGIGRRHAKRLEAQGIQTAYDFSNLPDSWIKKHMSVLELRLKKDLLGLPYIQLDETQATKKSIATTRSFQSNLSEYWEIEERVVTYANSCAEKLRQQKSSCKALLVFVQSNPHHEGSQQYRNSCVITLPYATDSSIILGQYAASGLKSIFKKGIEYKKAGVILMGLSPTAEKQLNLFHTDQNKHDTLMQAIDKVHQRFGPNRIKLANQDLNQTWKMRQEHLSARFTTELNDVIRVRTEKSLHKKHD